MDQLSAELCKVQAAINLMMVHLHAASEALTRAVNLTVKRDVDEKAASADKGG